MGVHLEVEKKVDVFKDLVCGQVDFVEDDDRKKSIEAPVGGETALSVTADESTLWRWRRWFWALAAYFLGCLTALAARYAIASAEGRSTLPRSALHRIWQLVGEAPGWLARVVRPDLYTDRTIRAYLAPVPGPVPGKRVRGPQAQGEAPP